MFSIKESKNGTESLTATDIAFVLTRDTHMVLMESISGNDKFTANTSKRKSIAVNVKRTHVEEGSKNDSPKSSQHILAEKNQSDLPKANGSEFAFVSLSAVE